MMKTRLLLSMLATLLFTTVAAQNTGLLKANYETNFGKMSLSINFETRQVTGFYGGDGKILGTIDSNNRITGGWVHNLRQGLMELDFKDDFAAFTGKFGVGNNLTGGVWQGESTSKEFVTGDKQAEAIEHKGIYEAEYNTDYGLMKLTFNFNDNSVKGTYGEGGRIEGTINGANRLTGTWGRIDRGRMEFDFTPDFKKFTGKWGEKENTLTDGVWMGESISVSKKQ